MYKYQMSKWKLVEALISPKDVFQFVCQFKYGTNFAM